MGCPMYGFAPCLVSAAGSGQDIGSVPILSFQDHDLGPVEIVLLFFFIPSDANLFALEELYCEIVIHVRVVFV